MASKTRTIYRTAKAKRRHGKPPMTISLAMVAGMVPLLVDMKAGYTAGGGGMIGIEEAGHNAVVSLTGYEYRSGHWKLGDAKGMFGLLVGMGAHKLASRLGVNRAIARAGIPLVRI